MAFFSYPNITSLDALNTWLNGLVAKTATIFNAFPGAAINASSVTVDKLAKQKARATWSFKSNTIWVGNNNPNLFSRTILNSDGAAANYNIVGWSVSVNHNDPSTATPTTLTKQAGVTLTWHKAPAGVVGAAFLTMDISSSSSLAYNVPVSSDISGAPLAISAGDVIVCKYNAAASASYPGLEVHLDYTLQHAGT